MLFNSFEFLVFLPLVFGVYWFILNRSVKGQNFFLLVASYVFYCWWDWRFGFLLLLSSLVDYFVALAIDGSLDRRKRKNYLLVSLVTNLGLLAVFKYFNFFSDSFSALMQQAGWNVDKFTLNVILPVGISFYTFQTLSYTIDVYRNHLKASRDIVAFSAYVSFFPQLVAGPIERAINLLPQFYRERRFSYAQASDGLRLIVWGFFKKVVIADNCAIYVNDVFQNYQTATGGELVLGAVLFAFQIYGDFSGYSDIAIGVAKMFGFELMINFRTPYFSRDIAEFWRRWHISLSTWFRDYLYFPLGGSKGPLPIVVRNTMIVFLVSGLWHGANWTFIVWGALNALYFLPLLLRKKNRANIDDVAANSLLPSLKEVFNMLATFALTCFAWIFFRSETLADAFGYIGRIVTADYSIGPLLTFPRPLVIAIAFLIVVDWFSRKSGVAAFLGANQKPGLAYCFDALIILLILMFGSFNSQTFIYFQF